MKFKISKLIKKKTKCVSNSEKNQEQYHKLSFDELRRKLNTSLENGLEQSYAKEILNEYGPNQIKSLNKKLFLKVLGYFFTGFCGLLWISSIICILAWKPIGNPPDAT
ncbi:unnamed protein product, partial [Brachionus calyciflorus]